MSKYVWVIDPMVSEDELLKTLNDENNKIDNVVVLHFAGIFQGGYFYRILYREEKDES